MARKKPGQRCFFSHQLLLQFTEGSNSFITEKTFQGSIIFQGGGGDPTFFQWGGGGPNAYFYRNPYNL